MRQSSREAALRFAERRERENAAPRLLVEVPTLAALQLSIEEHDPQHAIVLSKHVRRVVVEHAPALFMMLCGDTACRDGGHDLTYEIMAQLRRGAPEFRLEHECQGSLANARCGRVIQVLATCQYRG